MDLEFTPLSCDANGYFAAVHSSVGERLFVIASHSYQQADGSWAPKLLPGTYVCQRGTHTIHWPTPGNPNGTLTFVTFEVTGVPGHSGILFHVGNRPQVNSDGCNLTGAQTGVVEGVPAVLQSEIAFEKFMALQDGVDTFNLTVCE